MFLILNHLFRERSLSFRTWSTLSVGVEFLVDESMFLRTLSVEEASVCGCMWSWSWEHDKSLNKGQQDLTKLNTITSSLCRSLKTCKMLYLVLVEIAHQLRSMWYYGFISFLSKQILQVLWIENGRIFKSELYHTSQQLSQRDCPIRIFSHKLKSMYMEQTLCVLLS
jgi:hypothetical protein